MTTRLETLTAALKTIFEDVRADKTAAEAAAAIAAAIAAYVSNPALCSVYASGNQTVGNNAWTKITALNTVRSDAGGMWSAVDKRINIAIPGEYFVVGGVMWNGSAVGNRGSAVYVNGAVELKSLGQGSGAGNIQPVVGPLALAAGDYLELYGFQVSGGNLAALGAKELTYFMVARVL